MTNFYNGQIVEHIKSKTYYRIDNYGDVFNEADAKPVVIYTSLDPKKPYTWVRPKEEFDEKFKPYVYNNHLTQEEMLKYGVTTPYYYPAGYTPIINSTDLGKHNIWASEESHIALRRYLDGKELYFTPYLPLVILKAKPIQYAVR